MTIKVYGISTYNGQRVTLALLEFGVEDFELVNVDLAAKEHLKPEFLKIQGRREFSLSLSAGTWQPFGQIPVLEWGDFHLYESRAVVRYIAQKFKDQGPDILGESHTLEVQALVNQWVETEGHQFNMSFAPWSMEYYLAYKEKRPVKEEVVAPLHAKLEKFFDIVEKQLAKTKYMAADFYSMADLNISPSLLRVMTLQPALITTRKHVKAWYSDLTSRPMFKKMLEVDAGWKYPYGPFPQETAQQ